MGRGLVESTVEFAFAFSSSSIFWSPFLLWLHLALLPLPGGGGGSAPPGRPGGGGEDSEAPPPMRICGVGFWALFLISPIGLV